MSDHILEASDLQKFYGSHHALRGLTFTLAAGRILGLLGPNGAGKTTAIRILTTIIAPSSGSFRVAGESHDSPQAIRRLIGVLPESNGFPARMTATEYLAYFARLYGIDRATGRKRAGELLAAVGLADKGRTLISAYSRGMRQRLGIARALINDPVLLFLDEPTLGLDPKGQRELLQLLKRIAADSRKSILVTSHLLSEIEEICDDAIILKEGAVVASGTVGDVIKMGKRSALRIATRPEFIEVASGLLGTLQAITRVSPLEGRAGWLQVEYRPNGAADGDHAAAISNEILASLLQAGVPVTALAGDGEGLQEAFLQLTEH